MVCGVHTSVVVADLANLVSTAVLVVGTLHLSTAPGQGGISNMSVQTPTLSLSVDHSTLSVGSTLGSLTEVDTLPVAALSLSTGQTGFTVFVSQALTRVLTASTVGISSISWLTGTESLTSLVSALREWSTGLRQAGVLRNRGSAGSLGH